jgi:ribosome recycling factor
MKYFKTGWGSITEVEVEKVTDSYVYINGRRNKIKTSYEGYYKSYEEAVTNIIADAQEKLYKAKKTYDYYETELNKLKSKFHYD